MRARSRSHSGLSPIVRPESVSGWNGINVSVTSASSFIDSREGDMLKLEDVCDDLHIIANRETLWILNEISKGNNTYIGLQSSVSPTSGFRDIMAKIGHLMKNKIIRPDVDTLGLTRFYVNGERMADIAAFISGLGAKPVETRTTTCTVDTVAREVKALEDQG
jgi:hypothetical protein